MLRSFRCPALIGMMVLVYRVAIAQPIELPVEVTAGDLFGTSVQLATPYLVVGAPGDDEGGQDTGAAYVFVREEAGWRLQRRLNAQDIDQAHQFGSTVAIGNRSVVVGEPHRQLPLANAGVAHVFVLTEDGDWIFNSTLSHDEARIADSFGFALSLSGDRLLIGGHGMDGQTLRTGMVNLYEWNGLNQYERIHSIALADGEFGDHFGNAVFMTDRLTVFGAFGDRVDSIRCGSAYVIASQNVTESERITRLVPSIRTTAADFGTSVSIFENQVAVGAPRDNGYRDRTGAVYLYKEHFTDSTEYVEIGRLVAPDGAADDEFGYSVALGNGVAIIGAPGHDGLGKEAGAIYLFEQNQTTSQWTFIAKVQSPSGGEDGRFGHSLSHHNTDLLVGAPGTDFSAGRAYLYDVPALLANPPLSFETVVESLPNVDAVVQDRDGFLWFGGDGLHRFDGYELSTYRHNADDEASLPSNGVLTLLEDEFGTLWVGTDDGLCRFDRQHDRFMRYILPATDAYPRVSVVTLFEDKAGVLWTGSNGRLYQYNREYPCGCLSYVFGGGSAAQ